jgi:lysophospholipase L1-like esterase
MQVTRSGRAAPLVGAGSRQDRQRSVALTAGALVSLFLVGPAQSQTATPVAATTPHRAAMPSKPPSLPVALPADCAIPPELARFEHALTRTSAALRSERTVKIVAFGSSSTEGAGASSRAATYPSRLALELARAFPGRRFNVLNRGIGGELTANMMARLETDVIAEKPDLVLWQAGTNAVLHDSPLKPNAVLLHKGIGRMKAVGADVVLIDLQYAPKVLAKPEAPTMVGLIAATAEAEQVEVFRRSDLMRHWHEVVGLPFSSFLSPDGLHLNDWSYRCIAKALGIAIAEAARRPLEAPPPKIVAGKRPR